MNHQVVSYDMINKRYAFKLLITDLNSSYRLIIQYKLEEQLVDRPKDDVQTGIFDSPVSVLQANW